MDRLKGKIVLVTGAARGLGAAQAKALAAEGARVTVSDLSVDDAEIVAAAIRRTGGSAEAKALDVTSEGDWVRILGDFRQTHGRLDVLVNNAGVNVPGLSIETRTEDEWDRVMRVNAKSVFLSTKHAIPLMRAAGGGSIINISSVIGLGCGGLAEAAYAASKAAVTTFTKVTAAQHGKDGIRCNSIHPGPIETDMMKGHYASEERRAQRLAYVPLNRFGQPEEVAAAVVFLASDESAYISGAQLTVDGGSLAL